MREAVIIRGQWCEQCGTFEETLEATNMGKNCRSCGCEVGDHIPVKIVMIEAGNE